jgi:hypothetical protein
MPLPSFMPKAVFKDLMYLNYKGVTFQPNHGNGIHGWYPYIEGFSANFVSEVINEFSIRNGAVLDPFGGSGTTSLEACFMGLDSVSIDINPFMSFVAEVKTSLDIDVDELRASIKRIKRKLELQEYIKIPSNILKPIFSDKEYFSSKVLQQVKYIKWVSKSVRNPKLRNLYLLALGSLLVKASNLKRCPDLRYKHNPHHDFPLIKMFIEKIEGMASDIEKVSGNKYGDTNIITGDIKDETILKDYFGFFEIIITSPPYLNGTNYFRNTKLELWVLDFIDKEGDLSGYRRKTITASINSTQMDKTKETPFEEINKVVRRIERNAYDRRIPVMVGSYFNDMLLALKNIHKSLAPQKHCVIVVGDSFFGDTYIPTDEFLAGIASSIGFRSVENRVVRSRKSRGGYKLRETVLILKKESLFSCPGATVISRE